MIKIAMLGCDSSHTEAYANILHDKNSPFFNRAKIKWIWGQDPGQARTKASSLGIECVLASLADSRLNDADLFMVSGRFGEDHFEPAQSALQFGKPTYIDKPFTNCSRKALELKNLSEQYGSPLTSFSPLKFSEEMIQFKTRSVQLGHLKSVHISCPENSQAITDPKADNLYFYGIHASDLLCSIIKTGIRSIRAAKSSTGHKAEIVYADDSRAEINLMRDVDEFYKVLVQGSQSMALFEINPFGNFFQNTMEFILGSLISGNLIEAPLSEAIESVKIIEAMEASIEKQSEIYLS
jgi:predicted dehydrogenase